MKLNIFFYGHPDKPEEEIYVTARRISPERAADLREQGYIIGGATLDLPPAFDHTEVTVKARMNRKETG